MNRHTFAAVALAVLLVSAGAVAAAPGNAPTDAGVNASDDARADGDAAATNGSDRAEDPAANADGAGEVSANASATGEAASESDGTGPVGTLPEQVPDRVRAVHDLIGEFLSGDLGGSLGEAIRGLTANEHATPAGG